MNLRSGWKAEEDKLKNLGLTYNYKNSALVGGHLDEFEFDIGYQILTQTYWSNGTGTMDDIDVHIFNSRILYGTQYSKKLMLKTGIGYRKLYHYWQDRYSTTGAYGYDREQDYAFIPIIAELEAPIPELNLKGKLKLEFDHIFSGKHTAYMGFKGGGNKDLNFRNLGLIDYGVALNLMKSHISEKNFKNEIWFLEHNPVYTLGTAADKKNILKANNIPIFQSDRGGEVTYHGPGQLVIYFFS